MNDRVDRVGRLIAQIAKIGKDHDSKEEVLTALTICAGLELYRIADPKVREAQFKRFIHHVSRVARDGVPPEQKALQ